MNVTELARRLQMPTKDLLDLLPRLGFAVGKRAIKVDDRLVERITEAVAKERRRQEQTARSAGVKEVSLADQEHRQQDDNRRSQPLILPTVIIVRDLAERMKLPVAKVIGELMRNGVMASINERIDYETAAIIAEDLGFKPQPAETGAETKAETAALPDMRQGQVDDPVRPPVVVVMGHVDHGKTSLLDALRKTHVAQQESGNITQRLGAYQIEINNRTVTFLDTPGHEAFSAMRSRGGRAADVAILVVAADDGVQPQTIEALQIIQQEKLPFVVAINKIDKAEANVERLKQQLAELNVATEDYGGKAVAVPVSAKKGDGLKELLDTVLLVSDLEPPRAPTNIPAAGFVIESHVDKGEGPVASVLVQRGTLKVNNWVLIGEVVGKVRTLKDEFGHTIILAGPSKPVKILGLKALAKAGDVFKVVDDKKLIQEKLKATRRSIITTAPQTISKTVATKDETGEQVKKPELRLLVKSDTLGSLEAILSVLHRFNSAMVNLKVVKQGLGYVNDSDVLDAQTSGAIIVAYHITVSPSAEALTKERQVEVLHHDVIYKLLEELENRLAALVPPEVIRRQLGSLQILAIFKAQGKEQVVGGKVQAGLIKSNTKIKLVRGKHVIYGDLINVQSGKQNVTEVAAGSEAGILIRLEELLHVGDTLEIFQEEVNRRQLDTHLR